MKDAQLSAVLDRFQEILRGRTFATTQPKFQRYAITNFRGGIGKSTLAFNLAWELAQENRLLLFDLCSQRNFSQNLLGDDIRSQTVTIYDALLEKITRSAAVNPLDLIVSIKPYCPPFKGAMDTFLVPGSSELFLFPSLMYGQLATYAQLRNRSQAPSALILRSLDHIITDSCVAAKPDKVIMDTSPFFGGATHLAWVAAEALIIPTRVDQHSMDALRLTLGMLREREQDFHRFNKQSGIDQAPRVHAIVVTHCGWNRRKPNTPDNSTKYFIQQAIDIANEFGGLFTHDDLSGCIHLLDDFHSSGRISGTRRIPLSKLEAGQQYTVEGQRLEVNPSVDRYKKEVRALASVL